ncbi:response regulator [Wukongibacter sp. M2B1]|uniref:response regulator n=1 Tax=Wukongibacter sp. M2B1 TaxID=3088895 RepID=UPI003D7AC5D9
MNLVTALVVDDSLFMRTLIGDVIKEIGCTDSLHFAKDGVEALDIATELRPHLVTLNITMPNMSGIDVIEKMLEISPKAKIIMISAIHDRNTIEKAKKRGIVSYIVKPFEKKSLKNIIKYHLKG